MTEEDLGIISCIAPAQKQPQDLVIDLDTMWNVGIKSVCFRFKDEQIIFSRDEIIRALRDLKHMYRDKL